MVTKSYILLLKTDCKQPITAEASPIAKPLKICSGLAEELKLHLLKLANTEYKVTGSDLITEGLSYLRDTERKLLSCCSLYAYKVCKYTLCRFRTKIYGILCILGYTLEGLKHKVKLTYIGKIMLTAGRTRNLVLLNKSLHFCLRKCIDRLFKNVSLFCTPILNYFICSESFMAFAAIHKRICKSRKVTRCYPSLRIHKNSGIKTYVVLIFLNEFFPPSLFYVVLKLYAKRAVIPSISKSSIYFRAGKYKSSCFTKSDDFVHCLFCVFHFICLSFLYAGCV